MARLCRRSRATSRASRHNGALPPVRPPEARRARAAHHRADPHRARLPRPPRRSRGSSPRASCSRSPRRRRAASPWPTTCKATTNDVPTWRDEALMLNLAGFGPRRARAVRAGGHRRSARPARAWTCRTFRVRIARAATELDTEPPERPDGRDVVGAGADPRGGVAAGRGPPAPHPVPSAVMTTAPRRARRPRHRPLGRARRRRARDPAVPDAPLGGLRAGARPGRQHGPASPTRAAARRHGRDPPRPRPGAARLRRGAAGADHARPQRPTSAPTCATCAACSRASTSWRSAARSSCAVAFLLAAGTCRAGAPVASTLPRRDRHRGRHRRRRRRRACSSSTRRSRCSTRSSSRAGN